MWVYGLLFCFIVDNSTPIEFDLSILFFLGYSLADRAPISAVIAKATATNKTHTTTTTKKALFTLSTSSTTFSIASFLTLILSALYRDIEFYLLFIEGNCLRCYNFGFFFSAFLLLSFPVCWSLLCLFFIFFFSVCSFLQRSNWSFVLDFFCCGGRLYLYYEFSDRTKGELTTIFTSSASE